MASELVKLRPGDRIDKYIVMEKLGEDKYLLHLVGQSRIINSVLGGFGAVYKVVQGDKSYALKTENMNENNKVLKMEVYVMRLANQRKSKHFCICEDTGTFNEVLYVVMTMVGPSLQDHRKAMPDQKFSIGCALSVGIQSLEAIEDLHAIGFLHRDIKPSNFASGREEANELRQIYLLDFGMCRQYIDETGQIRKSRQAAGFRGTIRYAPLSCHVRRETCRKDDIESWLYQQIEITRGALPWRSIENRDQVAMYKERCRFDAGLRELMGGCPREYIEILRYTDALRYYDTPDYTRIYGLLKHALTTLGVDQFPYDWERKLPSTAVPSKTSSGNKDAANNDKLLPI